MTSTSDQSKTSIDKPKRVSTRSFGGLNFEGREIVSHIPLIPKSFKMQFSVIDDNKVANYNENLIMEYWNSNHVQKSCYKRLYIRFRHGIVNRTFPIILLYLLGHYLFAIIMLTTVCKPDFHKNHNHSTHNYFATNTVQFLYQYFNGTKDTHLTHFCSNYQNINEIWRQKEYSMTRILTLLIGFYVGFIVRTWWQQLRLFPTIDSLCMAMGSFVSVDSGIDEDAVGVKVDKGMISIKQFKKDIARLFLLSWTMCLCRISKPLKDVFN